MFLTSSDYVFRPTMGIIMSRLVITVLVCMTLVACSKKKERLQGERIDALEGIYNYAPSPQLKDTMVEIPAPVSLSDWTMAGQNTTNNIGNIAFDGSTNIQWKASIEGAGKKTRLVAPVFSKDTIFLMDSDHAIIALHQSTGKTKWTFEATVPDGDEDSFGGGLSLSGNRLFVSTPYGKLYSLDASTGKLLWEKEGFLPLAGGATILGDTGFVPNIDNTLLAFDITNGDILWRHVGFRESSALFGVAPPAHHKGILFAGYSNGELYAIRASDGNTLWSEGLSSILIKEGLDTISHVRGRPIIDNDTVFAISHGGRMLALDTNSGRPLWDRNIGSASTPWIAGNMVYITTLEGSIIAVHKEDGLVKWRTPVPRFEDEEDKEDAIGWSAPIMAGGKLWLVNSLGELKSLDPKTGTIIHTHDFKGKFYIAPMVVNDTLYILANDGTLYALGQ